jgi:leucyl-tRNA synthetase
VTVSSASALTTTSAVSRADLWAAAKLHYCQAANHARDYELVVAPDEDGETIKQKALDDDKAGKFIAGKKILRVVYVPQKLVNIVAQE